MQPRRPNYRAFLAFLFGAVAAVVIPVAIELTRKVPGAVLLDAAWAIPVAALAAMASLLFARGARGAIARTLERTGGSTWIRLGRILAVAGICLHAVGFDRRRAVRIALATRALSSRLPACSRSATACRAARERQGSGIPRSSSRPRSARSTSARSRRRTSRPSRAIRTSAASCGRTPTTSGSTPSLRRRVCVSLHTRAGATSCLRARAAAGAETRADLRAGAVLLVLAGIVVVAALVFAAWQIPGSSKPNGTGTKQKQQKKSAATPQIVLRASAAGRTSRFAATGHPARSISRGRSAVGETKLAGDRFYLLVRRPAGVHITLDGRAVSLPAQHNLRVRVTPKRTTRLRG